MADNTILNPGSGGDTVRNLDKGGVKTDVVALDVGGSGTEALCSASNPLPAYLLPSAAGGLSTFSLRSAATTNATSVKGSAGQLCGYSLQNTTASVKFVKLYDKASAPTVGTDTPVRRICLPANGTVERTLPIGVQFTLGIALAVTGAGTDADTTAVAAGDVFVNLDYK